MIVAIDLRRHLLAEPRKFKVGKDDLDNLHGKVDGSNAETGGECHQSLRIAALKTISPTRSWQIPPGEDAAA